MVGKGSGEQDREGHGSGERQEEEAGVILPLPTSIYDEEGLLAGGKAGWQSRGAQTAYCARRARTSLPVTGVVVHTMLTGKAYCAPGSQSEQGANLVKLLSIRQGRVQWRLNIWQPWHVLPSMVSPAVGWKSSPMPTVLSRGGGKAGLWAGRAACMRGQGLNDGASEKSEQSDE